MIISLCSKSKRRPQESRRWVWGPGGGRISLDVEVGAGVQEGAKESTRGEYESRRGAQESRR